MEIERRERVCPSERIGSRAGPPTTVQELSLAGNCLTSLPPEIGRLTSLKRLQLAGVMNLFACIPLILEGSSALSPHHRGTATPPRSANMRKQPADRGPLLTPSSHPPSSRSVHAQATFCQRSPPSWAGSPAWRASGWAATCWPHCPPHSAPWLH